MSLPWRARAVITAAGITGAVTMVLSVVDVFTSPVPDWSTLAVLCTFGALWVASWLWPLLI
ncbi:MAG: hypothetical protein ACREOE_16530 [Gemmatimonadales bacterium]